MNTNPPPKTKLAVIVMGPPGSGKGTQARFIAQEFHLHHINMGEYFRNLVKKGDPLMTEELIKQMQSGILLSPREFAPLLQNHIKEVLEQKDGLVFSGSPRTELEAFGDQTLKGFMPTLLEHFNKEDIHIFKLNISQEETYKRNTKRKEERGRADDEESVIKTRLEEYHKKTEPMFKTLEEKTFNVVQINGEASPEEVFKEIKTHLQ